MLFLCILISKHMAVYRWDLKTNLIRINLQLIFDFRNIHPCAVICHRSGKLFVFSIYSQLRVQYD